jgi:hypothetical protein
VPRPRRTDDCRCLVNGHAQAAVVRGEGDALELVFAQPVAMGPGDELRVERC